MSRFLAVLLLMVLAWPLPGPAHAPAGRPASQPRDSYLLLVNTAIAFMMDEAKLRQFDRSPYDGIAIAFAHAYETAEVPSVQAMDAKLEEWKRYTKKDIWPWVYLNRVIAFNPGENNEHAKVSYFQRIRGADLDNGAGARAEFLALWRNSLLAARHSGAPGVVFDPEFYNSYKQYDIGELARNHGSTPAKVATQLQQLGAEMADSAGEAYPDATVWFLVTGFTHPGYKTLDGVPYYPSPTYVAIGFLDEIAKRRLQLKVLSGGEGSLGYCHPSLEELRNAIADRDAAFRPILEKYRGTLALAGTMTLWSDKAATRNWVNEGACKAATAESVEQLQPYLELLLRTYRYNWVYGSSDGNYLPFSPQNAARFDSMIARARAHGATR